MVAAEAKMLKEFQRVDPTLQGKITVEESVSKQRKVLEKFDDSIVGRMVSQNGNNDWF